MAMVAGRGRAEIQAAVASRQFADVNPALIASVWGTGGSDRIHRLVDDLHYVKRGEIQTMSDAIKKAGEEHPGIKVAMETGTYALGATDDPVGLPGLTKQLALLQAEHSDTCAIVQGFGAAIEILSVTQGGTVAEMPSLRDFVIGANPYGPFLYLTEGRPNVGTSLQIVDAVLENVVGIRVSPLEVTAELFKTVPSVLWSMRLFPGVRAKLGRGEIVFSEKDKQLFVDGLAAEWHAARLVGAFDVPKVEGFSAGVFALVNMGFPETPYAFFRIDHLDSLTRFEAKTGATLALRKEWSFSDGETRSRVMVPSGQQLEFARPGGGAGAGRKADRRVKAVLMDIPEGGGEVRRAAVH
jgi:hypothetical protein